MIRATGAGALIEVVTDVAADPAAVFDLELDVDVHTASLARSGERATTSTGRRLLGPGDEVTFRARHFGLTWRMTSRVTAHERPHRFVDEQTRGPFRSLHHEHLFEPVPGPAGPGTRMTDRMVVTAPGGPLGAVLARFVLAPHLQRLLRQRAAHVRRTAEAAGPTGR